MSETNEIRRDQRCLDYSGNWGHIREKDKIISLLCHGKGGNQLWYVRDGLIRHRFGGCLEASEDLTGVIMNRCDPRILRQHWIWTKRRNSTIGGIGGGDDDDDII